MIITIKADIEKDISLIKEHFLNSQTEHFKNRILNFYKSLNEKLEQSKEIEKENIINNYFREIYKNKEKQINEIIGQSKQILEARSDKCLKELMELMDYKANNEEEFIATPTLLPYSPFNRPIFYFSIAAILFADKKNDILDTAVHEISHFLFFDILKSLGINLKNDPATKSLEHLFKEALTAMLLSEQSMENLLDRKNYLGNPEIHFLYIKESGKEKITLREYLRFLFKEYKQRKLTFSSFIDDTIKKLLPVAEKFDKKKIFWNKNEGELKKNNQDLLNIYSEPIEI